MSDKTPYDMLPVVPTIIADVVASEEYTGEEISLAARSAHAVEETERLRKAMSEGMRRRFAELCEERCRSAYEANAEWFVDIARAKDGRGRDQLYIWIRHWLSAYVRNPASLERDAVQRPMRRRGCKSRT